MVTLQKYLHKTPAQQRNLKKDELLNVIAELRAQGNANNAPNNVPTNADIIRELLTIRGDINEIRELKTTIQVMSDN